MTIEEMQKQIESMMPTPNQIVESIDKNLRNNMAKIDIEKEVMEYISKNCTSLEEPDEFLTTLMQLDDMVMFAKHFYELGIKTKKGE